MQVFHNLCKRGGDLFKTIFESHSDTLYFIKDIWPQEFLGRIVVEIEHPCARMVLFKFGMIKDVIELCPTLLLSLEEAINSCADLEQFVRDLVLAADQFPFDESSQ